jgi:hypothetical protein
LEEIAQFFFELVFQFLFELFADSVWRRLPEPARAAVKLVAAAAFAALLGFLSTLILPEPFITSRAWAIVHLVVGPLLVAWAMALIGRHFEKRDRRRTSLERFGYGWLFAFAFTLTRFLLLHGG